MDRLVTYKTYALGVTKDMTNIVLNDITSGYNISKINSNFQMLEESINNDVLNLAGGNNTLDQDIDMNSNDLLNVGRVVAGSITLNGFPIIGDTIGVLLPNTVGTSELIDGSVTEGKIDPTYEATLLKVGDVNTNFLQSGVGAVLRTIQDKAKESVSVKDFGATGDGVTDDTEAFRACLASCQQSGKTLYIPSGKYLVDTIDYGHPIGSTYSPHIKGDGKNTTTLIKKTADGLSVIKVNSVAAGGYTSLNISGLTIVGIVGDTSFGIYLTNCVRSVIYDVGITNCIIGFGDIGGITNEFRECVAYSNSTGFKFDRSVAPSLSSPNNCSMLKCIVVDNTDQGIYFDYGRHFTIDTCDVEGNGTGLGAGASGITIGSNLLPNVMGVVIKSTWIEDNHVHALQMYSGSTSVKDCNFVANTAVNDINIFGGNYYLDGVICESPKTYNTLEAAAALSGNSIINCNIPNINYNPDKTMVVQKGQVLMRGGSVPVVPYDTTSPLIQYGSVTPTTSGAVDIVFPLAFSASPLVIASVRDVAPDKVDCVQVSSFTTTGFHAQVTQVANGSSVVATPNNTINWVAIGPGA